MSVGVGLDLVTLNKSVGQRLCFEVNQDAGGVGIAGRFEDAGVNQVPEHRIINGVEPEPVVYRTNHRVEQPGRSVKPASGPGTRRRRVRRDGRWCPIPRAARGDLRSNRGPVGARMSAAVSSGPRGIPARLDSGVFGVVRDSGKCE